MNDGEDAALSEMGLGPGLSTGHQDVDTAMAAIGALGDADLATHVTTFERAHDALRTALTAPTEVSGEEDATAATDF